MVTHRKPTQTNKHVSLSTEAKDTAKAHPAELYDLPQGWDSYRGLSPTPRALSNAETLVAELARDFGRTLGDAAIPTEIFPNPDGELELEWSAGERMLGVETGPEGDARYLVKFGQGSDAKYSKGWVQASASAINRLLSAH